MYYIFQLKSNRKRKKKFNPVDVGKYSLYICVSTLIPYIWIWLILYCNTKNIGRYQNALGKWKSTDYGVKNHFEEVKKKKKISTTACLRYSYLELINGKFNNTFMMKFPVLSVKQKCKKYVWLCEMSGPIQIYIYYLYISCRQHFIVCLKIVRIIIYNTRRLWIK